MDGTAGGRTVSAPPPEHGTAEERLLMGMLAADGALLTHSAPTSILPFSLSGRARATLPGQMGAAFSADAGAAMVQPRPRGAVLSNSYSRGVVAIAHRKADGRDVYSDSDEGLEAARLEVTAPSRLGMPGGGRGVGGVSCSSERSYAYSRGTWRRCRHPY